ncbi:MAG TPA: T9SS type A sorting domain-containing protein [Bacteroidia bacterium]|nr:T9SS type A sorting domain-containing protein [Bacteroidia bacterium]
MKTHHLLFMAFLVIPCMANAQFGTLDPAFGIGGKVTTDIGGADDKGVAIAIQSDGKLVVTGFSYNGSDNDVALVRYLPDGSLDSTFGTNGKTTTPIGNEGDYGLSVALQPDGKIVVGGYSDMGLNNDFAILRYKSDGSLDSTFGTNGFVTTPVGSYGDNANSIALQPDGKIVAGGFSDSTTGNYFAVVRYYNDGSIDTAFGSGGKVVTHIGLTDDQCNSIVIQSDGKILAGGYSDNGSDYDFALIRYNPDGSPDASFGTNGIVTTDEGNEYNMFYAIALQSNGKIVGGGWSGLEFASARYNTDGSLDTSYASDGIVTTAVGINDNGVAVAIQADGKIIVGGIALTGTDYDFGLVRYNNNGTPDNTFGSGGIVTTPVSASNDYCLAIAIQADHKIVAAGFAGSNASDFALARYDAGPMLTINEASVHNTILVYPGPFINELTVAGTKPGGELYIYDLTGREIMKQQTFYSETKVMTSGLLQGMYLLQYVAGKEKKVARITRL